MIAVFLICVVIGFLVYTVLYELSVYRWWWGCYPWQKHEPRDWRTPIAVFDENGNVKYILDDE